MAFSINDIRANLQFGGARPSLFQVQIMNPASSAADVKSPFMVRTSELPASTLGSIKVPYFGRNINVVGTRTYDNWSCTVINDEDFLVRIALEKWSKNMNSYEGNTREFASAAPSLYKSRAQVTQYGQSGNTLRVYQMEDIFPLSLGAIELDWDSGNQIETFRVDFAVDNWTVLGESD